jgi:hypothetical protein
MMYHNAHIVLDEDSKFRFRTDENGAVHLTMEYGPRQSVNISGQYNDVYKFFVDTLTELSNHVNSTSQSHEVDRDEVYAD